MMGLFIGARCASCKRSAGFKRIGGDRVCNHCGAFNSQMREWHPALAKRKRPLGHAVMLAIAKGEGK